MTITGGCTMTDEAAAPRTLADLRRAAGLSQADVSRRMGVAKDQISKLEAAYPHLRYGRLIAYLEAIGWRIEFAGGDGLRVPAAQLTLDPAREATRTSLHSKGRGRTVWVPSSEELPLQGHTAQPGSDDSGRDEDHPDADGDQGDGGQRQQP